MRHDLTFFELLSLSLSLSGLYSVVERAIDFAAPEWWRTPLNRLTVDYLLFASMIASYSYHENALAHGSCIFLLVLLFHIMHWAYVLRTAPPLYQERFDFLLLCSACLVLPDVMLVRLGVLEFPACGLFYFMGAVPDFMAAMWAIPLLIASVVARRHGRGAGAAAGAAIFIAAEAAIMAVPIWRARRVALLAGGLAVYLPVPLAALAWSTLELEALAQGVSLGEKFALALGNAGLYAAALRLSLLAFARI